MATTSVGSPVATKTIAPPSLADDIWEFLEFTLAPLASLKLTVGLMAIAVLLIFIGTLAQTEADIWDVMRDYFRAWIAWVPLRVFTPKSFFPTLQPLSKSIGFYFPGGALVGSLLLLNLLAAHLVRFKTAAKGKELLVGWTVIGLGALLSALVILSVTAPGVQDKPWLSWSVVWYGVLLGLAFGCAASWVGAAQLLWSPQQSSLRLLLAVTLSATALALSILLVYCIVRPGEARLSEPSLRILWQNFKGLFAAVVVLVGCWIVFRQRAGIVVMHAGIGLLMLGEAVVSWYAVESQITLHEGESANFSRDIRTVELAFVKPAADADKDDVIVVPKRLMERSAAKGSTIDHAELPVRIVVKKYFPNADLRKLNPGETATATEGLGRQYVAEERQAARGTDMDSKVDLPAAYVQLIDKKSDRDLGTYLVSLMATEVGEPEKVEVGGAKYDLSLRFRHLYKDYVVTLDDVRKDDYPGTSTPRNYSSDVRLEDKVHNVSLTPHIWMNNPLRYGGETFYQSGYNKDEVGELTTLSVVSNSGWMIPYVALSFTTVGMLFHFLHTLIRFLTRWEREGGIVQQLAPAKRGKGGAAVETQPASLGWITWAGPLAMAVLFVWFVSKISREKRPTPGDFDFAAFGALPVVQDGRVKPFDTLARNALRVISNEESYKDEKKVRQPATRWLLDVITGRDAALTHQVFRIENIEVLSLFKLEPRPGFFRYSVNELRPQIKEFETQVVAARKKKTEELSLYERKLLELDNRFRQYMTLTAAFDPPNIPKVPDVEQMRSQPEAARQYMMKLRMVMEENQDKVERMKLPLVVPVESSAQDAHGLAKDNWQAYPSAYLMAFIQTQLMGAKADEGVVKFNEILEAYSQSKPAEFNQHVAEYQQRVVDRRQPAYYHPFKVRFERFFNAQAPFFWSIWLYFFAIILSGASFLFLMGPVVLPDHPLTAKLRSVSQSAQWSTFTLIFLTLLLHTFALGARIWISGRPPVTNLYSSAVFIGWGAVILGLAMELLFRIGVGNLLGAVVGFVTLWIAYFLSADGDTFTVLQAVLDTQFWLATHVTSITYGYAATFFAGVIGITLIYGGAVLRALNPRDAHGIEKLLGLMVYGIVCVALFCSFVGTVLGGLWADDSWGRFWGWDPKENGALMIVLWNALVLHARWGRMVGDRGMAVLAIGGNIVTAWSWFGVNELGVGLHSYGFTEGRLFYLGVAVLLHLVLMIGGVLAAQLARRVPVEEDEGEVVAAG